MSYLIIYLIGMIVVPIMSAGIEKKYPGIFYIKTPGNRVDLSALGGIALMWPLALFFLFILTLKYWIEDEN